MNKKTYIHLTIIFILALLLRMLYFHTALNELSINEMLRSLPDTGIYWTVARHLLEYNVNGEYWLFQVGVGYGGLLAGLLVLSNHNLYFLYYTHIILGSLIPVIMYLIAYNLFREKRTALIAGLCTAVSFTGVTLSANLLSDVPFVFLMSLSILLFILGINFSKLKWFIIAGILSGVGVYIRSITLFYPIVFVVTPIIIGLLKDSKIDKKLLLKSVVTAGIMLIFILGWSTRNEVVNDAFTFGANGMKTARLRLAALAVVSHTDTLQYRDVIINFSNEDSVVFNHQLPTFSQEYLRDAEHFLDVVREHPIWVTEQFFSNMLENSVCGNFIPIVQIKSKTNLWDRWAEFNSNGFGYLLILFTFSGLFILYRKKEYTPFVLLGLTYIYFTFFTGFTMWQGTRLHYPAEIAFSILSAVTIIEIYKLINKRFFTKEL